MFLVNTYLRASLFVYFLFYANTLAIEFHDQFHIWNVGQGQWATYIDDNKCLHFDMGGETAPLISIKKICKHKKNSLFVSHSDWDHIRYIKWAKKNLPDLCLYALPIENTVNTKKRIMFTLPLCMDSHDQEVIELTPRLSLANKANALSRIFLLKMRSGLVLIPGDSTMYAEKFWLKKLAPYRAKINYIVLGHHGSKTSTSQALIQNLPNLKIAFASARKKKYGHPHSTVIHRLQKRGVPVMSTEHWNHIKF